ncbi:hypothetical protein JO965_39315 (plasmid) [Microvirga sp. VF16]|nr:hypothetical protein JO965_39315 [Microvirga sp. VF16]
MGAWDEETGAALRRLRRARDEVKADPEREDMRKVTAMHGRPAKLS